METDLRPQVGTKRESSFDFIGDEEEDKEPYPLSSTISPGFGFPTIMVSEEVDAGQL